MKEPSVEILLVDAFTVEPFAGNPAGVVLEAGDLTDAQMLAIAREMHASRTAFVTAMEDDGVRLRCFGPAGEVAFCDHAGVAVLSALVRRGRIRVEDEPVTTALLTRAGRVGAELRPHPAAGVEVVLTCPPPRFRSFGYSLDLLCGILGMDRYQLPERWPLGVVSAGAWCLVVPATTRDVVDSARPDFASLAQLCEKLQAEAAMLYTWQGPVDLYLRGFAPGAGVPEDPVTAAGIAAVAALVVRERAVQLNPPETTLTAEQGTAMGRPGHLPLTVRHDREDIEWVRIAGTAVEVLEGRIRVQE